MSTEYTATLIVGARVHRSLFYQPSDGEGCNRHGVHDTPRCPKCHNEKRRLESNTPTPGFLALCKSIGEAGPVLVWQDLLSETMPGKLTLCLDDLYVIFGYIVDRHPVKHDGRTEHCGYLKSIDRYFRDITEHLKTLGSDEIVVLYWKDSVS